MQQVLRQFLRADRPAFRAALRHDPRQEGGVRAAWRQVLELAFARRDQDPEVSSVVPKAMDANGAPHDADQGRRRRPRVAVVRPPVLAPLMKICTASA